MGGLDGVRCVTCGKQMLGQSDHHCDPSTVKRIRTMEKVRERRSEREEKQGYDDKLADGFLMLGMNQ